MTRALTLLFAVAGGAAVGNLYYMQPLLAVIAASLHVSSATAGLLVTATQVGYASGIVLIVPLGDVRDRRRLIPLMMLASALALALCAVAPTFAVLAVAMVLVGVTFALSDEARSRVNTAYVAGNFVGAALGSLAASLLWSTGGWTAVNITGAALSLFALALWALTLPRMRRAVLVSGA